MTAETPTPVAEKNEPRKGSARELGHLVLYVRNLDRSLEFYRDILDWPIVIPPTPNIRAAGFRAGNTHHDFLLMEVGEDAAPMPTGRRMGMYHFGVKVGDSDDDLRAVLERMTARPDLVQILGSTDNGYVHSIYVTDPDGYEVELYVDIPGWDWSDPDLFNNAPRRRLQL